MLCIQLPVAGAPFPVSSKWDFEEKAKTYETPYEGTALFMT